MNIKQPPTLSFSEAFNSATSKIFQFNGRARRSEYWWMMVLLLAVNVILTPFIGFLVDLATIPLTFRRLHDTGRSGWWWGIYTILRIAFGVSFVYDLVMTSLNAENMRGYEEELAFALLAKYAIWLVVIGIYKIVLIVFMCMDSDIDENKYGKSPKYVDSDAQ
ncbi:MAG: DUF805 domain-containing protein [Prevotella sp.]|jgi:uncharacterized membrane protein YhaH (DUF805 family)|nr:DUF805 domain-containing protein [Prevotella sp.]MDO4933836.1 DUF805 domain-containing protein [Prevotella sp.]